MHDPSFLAGLELGKFLARLRRVEDGLAAVKRDLAALTQRLRRTAILAALWTFAILANASPDRAAEFAVEFVQEIWKR
jgi:hypothetical protein